MIDVGAVVANKYELVRLLGRGSMGEVWVAHHKTLGEKLALKLLTQGPSGSDEMEDARQAAARFQFEAQVAARLSRKTRHIVRVTDHGDEDGLAYLVMELLDGQTLETALSRTPTLPLGSVVKMVTQIARALTQAHTEGVLHRDLKPANVFLSTDEDGALLVKLLDFGIARAIHAHKVPKSFVTHKGVVFGTPAYMSPEQARASSKLDHRCDIWALATIAYEALTGDLPVAGNDAEELLKNLCANRIIPLRSRNPRLPHALSAFFDRAFAERIDDRYASAAEFARDFESACGLRSSGTTALSPFASGALAGKSKYVSVSDAPTPAIGPASSARFARSVRAWPRSKLAMATVAAIVLGLAAAGVVWRELSASSSASPATGDTNPTVAPDSTVGAGGTGATAIILPTSPAGQTAPQGVASSSAPETSGAAATAAPGPDRPPSFAHKSITRPTMGPAVPVAPPPVVPVAPLPVVTAQPAAPPPPPKPIDKSDVL